MDHITINKCVPDQKRTNPFGQIIYMGEGELDAPCMKMLKGKILVGHYPPKLRKRKGLLNSYCVMDE